MKNIFITAGYVHDKDYGILVDKSKIFLEAHNTKEEKEEYESNINLTVKVEPDIEPIGDYLYLLFATASDKYYGNFINKNNILIKYYTSEEEALESAKIFVKTSYYNDEVKRSCVDEDDTIENIEIDNLCAYSICIVKILVNRHSFINNEDEIYYKENLNKNREKEDLYKFLLDLVGGYQYAHYDISGKLLTTSMIDKYRTTKHLSLNSLNGFHVGDFNIGSKVKLINGTDFSDVDFYIIGKITQSKSIYESDDPLHFREGYLLSWDWDMDPIYLNEWFEDLIYDEELEPS